VSQPTPERIETARMTGERLRPEHAAELATLLRDPRVARTLFPLDGPPNDARVIGTLARYDEHWDRHGFGLWLLRGRDTGEMVGRGGLLGTHVGGADEVEVGWAIVPERWGQGLATELALASIAVAFGDLGMHELVSFALPDNWASRRVMEKSGFKFERDIVHVGLPHVLYRLRAEDLSARG
jgi:RimJ/RimL family protein N-acetyltransferase